MTDNPSNLSDAAAAPAPGAAYRTALAQFDDAAERLRLDEGLRAFLRASKRELTVHFPVRMDNIAREAMKHAGRPLVGAQVAVQGFGNVGYHAARCLREMGCTVVAVSDISGGLYTPEGLDVEAVQECKRRMGDWAGYARIEKTAEMRGFRHPKDTKFFLKLT